MSFFKEEKDIKLIIKDEKGWVGSGFGWNLWVSGLFFIICVMDFKNFFSKYGKVVGVKVVMNVCSLGV